ncbi:MAG: ABC transporter substrate-binding protein [Candidatus Nezhaarchaeales archaeon]
MNKWIAVIIVIVCVAAIAGVALMIQQPSPTLTLRIGYQPSWHHVAEFIMVEKGWVQKVLGVQVKEHEFPTGPDEMEAFAAGELDIGYVGATPPLPIIAMGAKAKIVAVANTEGSSLVVRTNFDYTGPHSLIGAMIGCYPPGSIQDTILKRWLIDNGIDPYSALTIVAQGPEEQMESLRSKSVDAVLTPDPMPYIAVLGGYGKIAINSSQMWPHHPCCVVLMSEDFIKEHRDLAVKFIALHIIASEYATDPKNREEVKQILINRLGITEDVANMFPGSTKFETDPRNSAWLEGLDYMCQVHYQLGITKNPEGQVIRLNVTDVVDPSLYEEALNLVPQIKAELGLD